MRLGEGSFGAGSATIAQFAEHVRIVRNALAEAGRDNATLPTAKRVCIGIDDDATRGRERMAAAMNDLYGPLRIEGARGDGGVGPAGHLRAGASRGSGRRAPS